MHFAFFFWTHFWRLPGRHQILGNSLAGWWRLPTAIAKLTNWMGGEESFEKQSHQFCENYICKLQGSTVWSTPTGFGDLRAHPQGLDAVDARCRGPGGRWWATKMDFQMYCKGCWLDLGLPVEKFSQSNVLVGASTLTRYLSCQVMETKSDRATAACYTCCRIRSKRGFSEKRQAKLSSW